MRCIDSASTAPDGQSTYGMDMWTRLHLDHIPPPEHDHRGIAYGLTRFACLLSIDTFRRGLVPLDYRMVGVEDGDSFALLYGRTVWVLSLPAGRSPGRRSGGGVASRATQQPVHRSTLPIPGRGITASRWRFGMAPAVAPMVQQGQPRTVGRGGTSP